MSVQIRLSAKAAPSLRFCLCQLRPASGAGDTSVAPSAASVIAWASSTSVRAWPAFGLQHTLSTRALPAAHGERAVLHGAVEIDALAPAQGHGLVELGVDLDPSVENVNELLAGVDAEGAQLDGGAGADGDQDRHHGLARRGRCRDSGSRSSASRPGARCPPARCCGARSASGSPPRAGPAPRRRGR